MKHGAFILARYSTENQNETSIEVQVSKCAEWCDAHTIPVLGIFADRAVSGMKSTRPEYDKMMISLRNGGADTVVIYDQSRMFRDMLLWFQFRGEVDALGVRVVSVTQPSIGGDLRDPAIFINEGINALFNQMWVLQTTQKVRAGVKQRALSGKHTGGTPPLGYRVENERLVVDEAEAKTVSLIFEMYASGSSYTDIICELNKRGLTTKRGRPFGKNSLHDLLKNQKYKGIVQFGGKPSGIDGKRNSHASRGEGCVTVSCPSIVPPELFERVEQRLKANQKSTGRRTTVEDQPLKGKVFCGDCGSAMTVAYSYSKKMGKKYGYYKCAAKKRGLDCSSAPISKDELEDIVAGMVLSQLGESTARRTLLDTLERQRMEILKGRAPELDALNLRLKELTQQIDRATDSILAGLSSPTLVAKINEIEAEKASVTSAIARIADETKHLSVDVSKLDTLLDALLSDKTQATAAALSMVLRVEVHADCLKVWTLFDDDPTRDKGESGITKHTIQHFAAIDPPGSADVAYNSGCTFWRTNIYAQFIIVTLVSKRLRKR